MIITPTFTFNLAEGWFVGLSDYNFTFNWESGGAATVPLGLQVGKVVTLGKQPVSLSVEAGGAAARPSGAPSPGWILGFEVSPIFNFHLEFGREDQGAERLMKQSQQPGSTQSDQFSYSRPQVFLGLFRNASSQTLAWTGVAVAVAWLPLAMLSALRGSGSFRSFLTDYATQSRFLIVIPVLILSTPSLHERRRQVAEHIEKFLVPRVRYPEFMLTGLRVTNSGTHGLPTY